MPLHLVPGEVTVYRVTRVYACLETPSSTFEMYGLSPKSRWACRVFRRDEERFLRFRTNREGRRFTLRGRVFRFFIPKEVAAEVASGRYTTEAVNRGFRVCVDEPIEYEKYYVPLSVQLEKEKLCTRVPPTLKERLRRAAEVRGLTMSRAAANAVENWLEVNE